MERDEVQGFTRVMTQLCSSRPFDDYSVPIRSLIGKLEAETAAHLDEAARAPRTTQAPLNPTRAERTRPGAGYRGVRAKARQAFVQPILEKQSLSMNQWLLSRLHLQHGSGLHDWRDHHFACVYPHATSRPLRIDRENLP